MSRAIPSIVLAALACATALVAAPGSAAARDRDVDYCLRQAERISGYHGQEKKSALSGAMKGGLGGAAVGAAGGWALGGTTAGKGAKTGAALGAVVGAVKVASDNKKTDRQRREFERVFDDCMYRR